MKIIVDGYGKSVAKRDNQIIIKENGKEKDYFLAKDISQIILTGKGSITFDAMHLLSENDVDCISINWKGYMDYILSPPEKRNIIIKKEQYSSLNDKRSGILAKSFIKAKIENQKAVLGTLSKSRENNEILINQRNKLDIYLDKLDSIQNKPIGIIQGKIFGVEGQSAIEYWKGFKVAIDKKWGFQTRSGRGATDPVNAMLNYGYAVLQGEIWKNIYLVGLDPYCGFLHSDKYGRTSLVFDIMEEFRQQIVDKTVLSILNKKQVKIEDFEFDKGRITLLNKSRHLIISQILKKINNTIKFNEKRMDYSEIILYQCRLLARYLQNKDEYVGFSLRW